MTFADLPAGAAIFLDANTFVSHFVAEPNYGVRKTKEDAHEEDRTMLLGFWMAFQLKAEDLTWLTSVPDATARAKKESKLVLLDFTGSDWCSWCKKLDAEVFSKAEFADYAKKNLVLVTVSISRSRRNWPPIWSRQTTS